MRLKTSDKSSLAPAKDLNRTLHVSSVTQVLPHTAGCWRTKASPMSVRKSALGTHYHSPSANVRHGASETYICLARCSQLSPKCSPNLPRHMPRTSTRQYGIGSKTYLPPRPETQHLPSRNHLSFTRSRHPNGAQWLVPQQQRKAWPPSRPQERLYSSRLSLPSSLVLLLLLLLLLPVKTPHRATQTLLNSSVVLSADITSAFATCPFTRMWGSQTHTTPSSARPMP